MTKKIEKEWDGIEVRRDENGEPEVAWTVHDGQIETTLVLTPEMALEAARRLLKGAMAAYKLSDN